MSIPEEFSKQLIDTNDVHYCQEQKEFYYRRMLEMLTILKWNKISFLICKDGKVVGQVPKCPYCGVKAK